MTFVVHAPEVERLYEEMLSYNLEPGEVSDKAVSWMLRSVFQPREVLTALYIAHPICTTTGSGLSTSLGALQFLDAFSFNLSSSATRRKTVLEGRRNRIR